MHTKNLEFPPLVTSRTEVPPDGPPPYSSDDETKTIVFLLNEGRMHRKCFAIFMDLKIIQAFDSGGSGGGQTLQDLYRWLHSTMEIEGKTLKPAE